jgi:hypothetical protein
MIYFPDFVAAKIAFGKTQCLMREKLCPASRCEIERIKKMHEEFDRHWLDTHIVEMDS